MRQINESTQPNTGLGERVKPAPAPAPAIKPTKTPGIFERDGKLEAHIPTPPRAWDYVPPAPRSKP